MNLRPLLLFLCALLPSWLLADNIPVGKAQELAADFFKVNAQTRNASPQLQLVWDGEDATTRSNETPLSMYLTAQMLLALLSLLAMM